MVSWILPSTWKRLNKKKLKFFTMKSPVVIVGWLVLILVIGFYIYGVCVGIFDPDPVTNQKGDTTGYKIADPLDFLVITMATGMMVNLMALLGIPVLAAVGLLTPKVGFTKTVPTVMSQRKKVQLVCGIIYVLALLSCLFAWLYSYFNKKEPNTILELAPFVVLQAKAAIGVAVAFVAFVIGRIPDSAAVPVNAGTQ